MALMKAYERSHGVCHSDIVLQCPGFLCHRIFKLPEMTEGCDCALLAFFVRLHSFYTYFLARLK